jgi:hypothetical protein
LIFVVAFTLLWLALFAVFTLAFALIIMLARTIAEESGRALAARPLKKLLLYKMPLLIGHIDFVLTPFPVIIRVRPAHVFVRVTVNALADNAGGRLVVDDFTGAYTMLLFLLDAVHDPLLELRSDRSVPPSGQRLMDRLILWDMQSERGG